MKTTILSLVVAMIIPAVSSAKVEDFNAMITENAKSQEVLHADLKEQIQETRQAQLNVSKKEMFQVAGDINSVNAPTSKTFLTFEKEAIEYRPSESKKMKRLANEIKAHDASF